MAKPLVQELVLVAAVVTSHTRPNKGHTELLPAAAMGEGGRKASKGLGKVDNITFATKAKDVESANDEVHTIPVDGLLAALEE